MRRTTFITQPAAISLGLMLSPETLSKLGSGLGESGTLFVWLLGCAALAQACNAWSYDRLQHFLQSTTVESSPLGSLLGHGGAHLAPMAIRLPAFVCLNTAVLATAGFVFNEVFVYWFPNFAFAFLLLGFLLLLSLLSPRGALVLQSLCAGAAVAGLIGLSVAGLVAWSNAPLREATGGPAILGVRPVVLCLTLFMGFELSLYGPPSPAKVLPSSRLIVAAAAVLLLMWSLVSVYVVPMDRLAGSSVPHMVTARAIFGETGRIIMGIVVLAGCCGVVNGSFLALYGLASDLVRPEAADAPSHARTGPGRIGIVLVAGAVAALLGYGFAGEPELEVWLRGSALLWLLGYALFHLSLCILTLRGPSAGAMPRGLFQNRAWVHGACFALFLSAVTASVWTDPQRTPLFVFLVVAPLVSCIILLPWRRVATGRRLQA